ncbi:MAG TPA: biopolymer transporter ExbD [Cytophagales bacterium]|nr:biopolymer transporter ExbD [Cytophagales bacterium]HAA19918.1 biopolymer transporter ExbD [Cytophagales bacterium]HAP62654.1 biopolymer transporter ExbD [Cytophagales bacterium]
MSKFKKKSAASQDIPTSALPDIIFMLLFFFMVTTVMREQTILVEQDIPKATQLRKLERKSLISYIYIGKPKEKGFGEEPRIQVNDVFISPSDLIRFVQTEKDKLSEAERNQITMALKVDDEAKMGIVTDVQLELRKANALKIMYNAIQGVVVEE